MFHLISTNRFARSKASIMPLLTVVTLRYFNCWSRKYHCQFCRFNRNCLRNCKKLEERNSSQIGWELLLPFLFPF